MRSGELHWTCNCTIVTGLSCSYKGNLETQIVRLETISSNMACRWILYFPYIPGYREVWRCSELRFPRLGQPTLSPHIPLGLVAILAQVWCFRSEPFYHPPPLRHPIPYILIKYSFLVFSENRRAGLSQDDCKSNTLYIGSAFATIKYLALWHTCISAQMRSTTLQI